MKEIWKAIPGYESQYEVSNLGRVRSLTREVICLGGKTRCRHVAIRKGRLLRPGRNTKLGHVTVALGRHNTINVHRLVMLAFIGACPKGREVLHANGIASDNRISNLRYGTRSENNRDIISHGNRKVNIGQIREIRSLANSGLPKLKIGSIFSISRSAVYAIINRSYYKHV